MRFKFYKIEDFLISILWYYSKVEAFNTNIQNPRLTHQTVEEKKDTDIYIQGAAEIHPTI